MAKVTHALSRIGDVIYGLLIGGLIAGFGWAAVQALGGVIGDVSLARDLLTLVVAAALVVLLGLGVALLEKAFPFMGFTEQAWVYKYRLAGQWPLVTWSMVGQVAAVLVLAGALTFLVFPHIKGVIIGAAAAAVARIVVGLRGKRTLDSLLARGRRRDATLGLVYVDDADSSSNALAALWGSQPVAQKPTTSQAVLGWRRLKRRHYLLSVAVMIMVTGIVAAAHVGVLALVAVAVAWAVLAAGIYRAVSLNAFAPMVNSNRLVEVAFLIGWGVIGAVCVTLINGGLFPAAFYFVFVVMVAVTGWWRGQPRNAQHAVVYDPATGTVVPVGLLRYYSTGLPAAVAGALGLAILL